MRRILPTSLVALLMIVTLSAGQKPDLSGTWAVAPNQPSAVLGAKFALRLDGETLVVTRVSRDEPYAVTHKLDGTRTTFRVPGRLCEGDLEVSETAAWEGAAVALTTVGQVPPGGGAPRTFNAKRLLRREGDTLIIDVTLNQKPTSIVYMRSTEPLPAPKPGTGMTGTPATIAQAAWISGTWVGTTGVTTTEERWTPAASGGMMAVSRTLRSGALSGFEFLCIAERQGSLVYIAMPDARTPPTLFTLTKVSGDSATFENPTHDYPQFIRYSKTADGSLETTIAGAQGARPMSVTLKRQE